MGNYSQCLLGVITTEHNSIGLFLIGRQNGGNLPLIAKQFSYIYARKETYIDCD